MIRVLLTGMSGTGKSAVIRGLAARGYKAIDADDGWSETGPDGDWLWREERIQRLLSTEDSEVLFLSGCATNQGKFYPQFDHIVLLSAPAEVIVERLATRASNPYGKDPEELAQVLHHLQTVEPLLRKGAGHEIDTRAPLDEVVESILQLVQPTAPSGRRCSRCGDDP
jgi:dephospho-CoA kinase